MFEKITKLKMKFKNVNLVKKQNLIILLLIVMGLYRFMLIDRGALAFPDERRHLVTAKAVERLIHKDIKGFCAAISNTDARPGDATIRIIPVIGQGILYALYGIDPQNPDSLRVSTLFNVIISVFVLLIFYKVSLLLFNGNYTAAVISTIVYSFLANSNIYVRHLLPADNALVCFLFAIFYALKNLNKSLQQTRIKKYVIIGLLSGFGFSVYPAYYFFPALIFVIVIFKSNGALLSRSNLIRYLAFLFSALSVLIFYEIVAKIGETSYLVSGVELAKGIYQGSFEEGFTFLAKYMAEAENVAGIFILAGTIIYLVKEAVGILKNKSKSFYSEDLRLLIFIMLIVFILQASVSAIFHKITFCGRYARPYFLFLVWATVSLISKINKAKIRNVIFGVLLSLSLYSFLMFSFAYFPIAYPRDILYKHGIMICDIEPLNVINETEPFYIIQSPPPLDVKTNAPYRKTQHFRLINFCYFYPIKEEFQPYRPGKNENLIYRGRHFLCFPAYGYEGFSIRERQLLKDRNYQISIYERGNR